MEFHLIVNGKQEGPFSVEELAQRNITPESEVWALAWPTGCRPAMCRN